MKEFLEAIEKNPELKARIEALKDKKDFTTDDIIAIAKEYGFELSDADFKPDNGVLSDDELAAVSAAGDGCVCIIPGFGGDDGYGRDDGLDCYCIGGGVGVVDDKGKILPGEGACVCPLAGIGATNRRITHK